MTNKNIFTRLKLLLLALFISGVVIVATGLLATVMSLNLRTGKSASPAYFLQAQFLLIYTLSALTTSLMAIYLWKKTLQHKREILPKTLHDPLFFEPRQNIPVSTLIEFILLTAVFSFGADFINSRIFFLPEITEWQQTMLTSARGSATDMLLLFLSVVILAPLWEELIFRGIIYSGFSLLLPSGAAVLLSTLCWSLSHARQYNPIILIEIVIIGIILCLARIRSKSLRLPIIIHITNNLIAFLNLYTYSNTL